MTQNQISYAKLQEDKRHNLATEGQKGIELDEVSRHNKASEGISWYGASETERHNRSVENLNWYMAPAQLENQRAQAYYNMQRANYTLEQAEDIDRRYELDKQKVENELFTRLKQLGMDERKVDLSEKEFNVYADRVQSEIADLFFREDLDWSKYKTDFAQKKAQAFSQYASGAKSLTDAFLELFDWGWGMKQGLLPTK